jgi:hypothetical protein
MPDTRTAESILALVTSRDRAASTVGDLLEQSANRGEAWFWSGVLRTATSLLWRGFADNAGRMVGLAFLGLVIDAVSAGIFAATTAIVYFLVAYIGEKTDPNSLWMHVYMLLPILLSSYWVGRILSRLAGGRDLSAAVAYIVLVPIAMLLVETFFAKLTPSQMASVFFLDAAQRLPALVGAAQIRRRRESPPTATV